MTPFSFEWQWAPDYFVFMGSLYFALTIIGCGLVYALVKTWLDISREEDKTPEEIPYRKKYSSY